MGTNIANTHRWPIWPRVCDEVRVMDGIQNLLGQRIWTTRASGPSPSFTERAEGEIAQIFGAKRSLLVSSGTTAVELAIRALKLPDGTKVIVPALGWFATAAAVCRAGAVPVFCDVDKITSCIAPERVEELIDQNVRAIVAVHLHCAVAALDRLKEIADRHNIALIEDCAQAHGAYFNGAPVGTIGTIGCFSFNQEKLIAVGEGGCVITQSDDLQDRLYALRTDGYVRQEGRERTFVPHGRIRGGNACTSEFAALLCSDQLRQFGKLNVVRQANALKLSALLEEIDGVRPLASSPGTTVRAWHEFAFEVDPAKFGGWSAAQCGRLLEQDLGFPIHQTDEPTQDCPLLQWESIKRPAPNAQHLYERLLVFHHRILLDPKILEVLPDALRRLQVTTKTRTS